MRVFSFRISGMHRKGSLEEEDADDTESVKCHLSSDNANDAQYDVFDCEESDNVTKSLEGRRTSSGEGGTLCENYMSEDEAHRSRQNSVPACESMEVDRYEFDSKLVRVLFMLYPVPKHNRFEVQERSMYTEELSTHTRQFDDLQLALNCLRDTSPVAPQVPEKNTPNAISKSRSPVRQKRSSRTDKKRSFEEGSSISDSFEARKRRKNSFNSHGFVNDFDAATERPSRLKQRNTLLVHTGFVPHLQDKRDVDGRSCLDARVSQKHSVLNKHNGDTPHNKTCGEWYDLSFCLRLKDT